ncbi:MAG: dipeptidyl-peptidase 5 [Acidobacteriaceae bacterium]
MPRLNVFRLLLLACLVALPAMAQAKRPMTFEDMMQLKRLGDPQISPSGKWVLFSAVDVDLEKNTRISHLWIVPAMGGDATQVTSSLAGESNGRFSPDGKQVLFLSARDGSSQIYLAGFHDAAGTLSAATKLTDISTEGDGAIWSPDGKNILFVSKVYPDCADDTCNHKRDAEAAESPVKARIFTHLLYRHWNAFTGDKRSHLFLIPVAGGTPRDLTPASNIGDHETPPFSLGGPQDYSISPDGKELAYTVNLDPVPAISTNNDVFTLRLDDPNAKPVKISTSPGSDDEPEYSPDGRYIAFRSQARAGYESDRFRLLLYDRVTKQTKELLPKFDRWVDEFVWAPDSKSIYLASGNFGDEPVFQLALDGHFFAQLTEHGEYSDLHPSVDGKVLIATRVSVRQPATIDSISLTNIRKTAGAIKVTRRKGEPVEPTYPDSTIQFMQETKLTHLNDAVLAKLDLPKMQSFWFNGSGRVRVEGFLIKPPNFDATKKYPVKFLIHGGPQGAWGNSWSYRWNAELFAANGYVVIMINPRGSTGYGQAFIDGVNGDWGGRPYIDLMRGLTHAELHYPFIDKNRECALGASYGGYMANWILGHTDRFKCIVTHDGIFNPESAYGSTDELWFAEWEFKGKPWDYYGKPASEDPFRRWSPALYAKNFKTPTLVVHSQHDYRLDVSEGYQLFTTLQRLGVPSKMLYFPDESHFVLKPQNSQLWYKTVNDWVDQYTATTSQNPAN